jgi:hypothetical protein
VKDIHIVRQPRNPISHVEVFATIWTGYCCIFNNFLPFSTVSYFKRNRVFYFKGNDYFTLRHNRQTVWRAGHWRNLGFLFKSSNSHKQTPHVIKSSKSFAVAIPRINFNQILIFQTLIFKLSILILPSNLCSNHSNLRPTSSKLQFELRTAKPTFEIRTADLKKRLSEIW